MSSFVILEVNPHFEIMIASSGVDGETWLACLVADQELHELTYHHHGAVHKVVHHIFTGRHECLLIDQEEVNLLICDNLKPDVSLDEVDLTSHVLDLVVLLPLSAFWIDLEEQD